MPLTEHTPGPLSERDAFFFDLHGAIIVRGAVERGTIAACNRVLDRLQHLKVGEWDGWVHGHNFGARDGLNLQQIFEAGAPFDELLDHPSWYEKVRALVGGENTFDYAHGPLFVDECFANIRGPGEAIPVHSGGFNVSKRCQFEVREGKFHCSQINVLLAMNDIGPGDGATMVVPASHKSHFRHPQEATINWGAAFSVDGLECATEVHLRAGDALIFTDAIMHGSAARVNGGQRRNTVYRYGPSWGRSRHGYVASPDSLARLTPARRQLVQPTDPVMPPVAALAH